MSISKKYTEQEFKEAVLASKSISEALKRLGLKVAGGNYKTFHQVCSKFDITTAHFLGRAWSKGRSLGTKSPLSKYVGNKKYVSSYRLKQRLLKEGILHPVCAQCQLTQWNEKPIPTELHHIDGNPLNNTLENLCILCPNCHAQTSNYRSKNKQHN